MPPLRDDDEDEDAALGDEEWKDPEDRDPDRDRKLAKKHLERAYREALKPAKPKP